jgi:RNase P subunit RPR2
MMPNKTLNFKQMKDQRKKIALERIEILEGMAEKKPEFANRYRALIKRLTEKYRLQKDF